MVWIENGQQVPIEQRQNNQASTQREHDQHQQPGQDQLINDQEFQQELQRQEQIDQQGDLDYEADTLPDPQVPQRVTRSKNNIHKRNTRYEDDYVELIVQMAKQE